MSDKKCGSDMAQERELLTCDYATMITSSVKKSIEKLCDNLKKVVNDVINNHDPKTLPKDVSQLDR